MENGLNEEQKRELEELVDRLIFASLEEGAVVRSLSEIPGNEGDTEQTIENESAMEATLGGEVPRISGFEDTIQAEVADVNKLS